MTTAATIATRLTLDSSQFNKGLIAAQNRAKLFATQMTKVSNKIGGWGSSINGAIGSLSSGLKSAGSALTMGVTVPLVAASAGVIALGVNAMQAGAKFDTQMKNIQSISRQTDGEIQMLGQEFMRMSNDLGTTTDSATLLAEGFYFIQSSGFAGADGMEVLRVSTKAATAGLSDTATASQAILSTLNAYGMSAMDASHVSDVLFKTVDLGVLTFGDLAGQLGDVVNTANMVNVPIETVGAAFAQMTRKGVSAAEAATALNQLMLQFVSPSKKMKDATEELGLGLDFLSVETIRKFGIEGALQQLVAANPDALLQVFGDNVRALKGALTLGGENMPGFIDMLTQMKDAAGRTDAAFATQTKSLEAYGKNIKNVLENVKISFTQKFGPGLTRIVGRFSEALSFYMPQIGGLFIRLQGIWEKVVDKIVGLMSGDNIMKVFEFFNRLIDAIPQVWTNLKKMWENIQPVLKQLFEMLFPRKAEPTQQIAGITTFILALGALGPILSTMGTILPLLGPVFLALGSGVSTNGPQIVAFFQNLAVQIPLFIAKLQEIGTVVGPALQKLFDMFMNMNPETMLNIITLLGGLAALAPLFIGLGAAISVVSTGWTALSAILFQFIPWLVATAIPAIAAFVFANIAWIGPLLLLGAVVALVYLAVKNNFLGIQDVFRNVALKVGEFIFNLINSISGLRTALSSITLPAWMMKLGFAVGTGVSNLLNIPVQPTPKTRDRGGMGFAGQAYSIGVGAQPEMFVPSNNGHFTPNAGSGGNGGDTYNIVVNNPKKETAEQSVRRALKSISYTGAVAQ